MSQQESQTLDISSLHRVSGNVCEVSSTNFTFGNMDVIRRLNDIGGRLFIAGCPDDAIAMYDMAVETLMGNYVSPCKRDHSTSSLATNLISWGEDKLSHSKSKLTYEDYPLDTYQDGEFDPGPRPFRHPVQATLSEHNEDCSTYWGAVVIFNRALVHHSKTDISEATDSYVLALNLLKMSTSSTVERPEDCFDQVSTLGMLIQNNIGQIKYLQGNKEEASSHFLAALNWATRLHHDEDKSVRLQVANVLSNFCRTQWTVIEIETDAIHQAVERVLNLRLSVLEWDHLDVASAHYNLGVLEFERGNCRSAHHHLLQYIKIIGSRQKRELKDTQPTDAIPALSYIVLILNDSYNDEQSMALSRWTRHLLDKRQEVGRLHFEVATILNIIGGILFHQDELEYAIDFYQEELRVEKELLRPEEGKSMQLSLAVTLNNIGRVLQEQGNHEEAISYFQKALQSEFESSKCGAELMAWTYTGNDAVPPRWFLKDEDARFFFRTAYLISTIWYNLGLAFDVSDKPNEAIRSFEMSLKFRRAMVGPDHPDVACLWYNIGTLQVENYKLTEAAKSLGECLRIRRLGVICQQSDTHIVSILQKLARLHQNRGNAQLAIEAYSQVLEVQRTSNSDSMHVGITLCAIAELQHSVGDIDSALDTADQSLHAFLWSPAMHHVGSRDFFVCSQHVGTILLAMGSLYHERCDAVQARLAYQEAERIVVLACESITPRTTPEAGDDLASTNISPRSTLLPLLEVSRMLGCTHCAPQA